ncbi:conjugal transfer protein [Proteus mirabilis]|uniref:VirB4 family type IV secretion/conjugal transfer ATPase n=1 Tax=Morganellaceae TaxID=1903414 RepID=UPI00234A9FC8|nr:conjugal transfer protein [Providencia sp. PROV271]
MSVKKIEAEKFIPDYAFHIDENMVYLSSGKLIAPLFIEGFPFESVNDHEIVNRFNNFSQYLLGQGKQGNLFVWSHIIKRRMTVEHIYRFKDNAFLQGFADKYIDSLSNGEFYRTDYVLTLGISVKPDRSSIQDAIERLNEIIQQTQAVLQGMQVIPFGVKNAYMSEIAGDYLSYLINHEETAIPLSGTRIKNTIANSDIFFGFDVAEIRPKESNGSLYCTNYVVKDFPRSTKIGQWDFLLKLPYEFILTQSFIAEAPAKSIKKIDSQLNQLSSSQDAGVTQQEELLLGQEGVTSGSTLFGSYHAVLTVFGESVDKAKENGVKVSSEFITSGKGFRFIKSTDEAPFTYFSHLPMSEYRPLASQRTSNNLACLFSLHNFSYGKEKGNPIGDGSAIMPLKTVSDTLYFFNTHFSDLNKDVRGQKMAGHALILGASETGKTTFEGTATGFLQRFNPDLFVIDFNRSTELFVRAYGGTYFALQEGVETGLNPFQIGDADDVELVAFLMQLVKRAAIHSNGEACSDIEARILDDAVKALMQTPRHERHFGALMQSIPDPDLQLRLYKWCEGGEFGWATDSKINTFNPQDYRKVGFDTTVILKSVNGKDHPACELILSILFFYKSRMQKDGRLMLSIVEEFWKPANFPMTQEMIKEVLKAGRMKGEMMWLTSQSPEDAVNCQIFEAIVQQTSTKICLPNPDAEWSGYKRIGLTPKEFDLLKKLSRVSRTMLIKQSNSSAFAKMDLYGFDDYLPVISGSQFGITLCELIRADYGDHPDHWLPIFIDCERLRKKIIKSGELVEPTPDFIYQQFQHEKEVMQ